MKGKNEYSEKEKAIFSGIMDLLNRGHQIHELKVADIAAAAGIGKGTAYEYFTTKEEIIRQALRYHVYREFEAFTAILSSQRHFTDMVAKIMDYTVDMLRARFSSMLFMVLNLGQSEMEKFLSEDSDLLMDIRSGMDECIAKMYETGREDGLIGADISVEDCRLVLYGILSAFTNEVIFMRHQSLLCHSPENSAKQPEQFKDEGSLTELKERTVRLILKALK